jgi:hypothetical protein
MSTIPGNFTETRLLQVRDRADRLMLDGRIKQQYIPKIATVNYLKSLENPNLNVTFNNRPKKEYDVEIHWMNTCADFTINDESCVLGGHEASTNAQTYTLYKRIVKGFTIKDDQFRDNEYDDDEALAKLMLQVDKQIAEEWARYITARLNLFAGVNQVTNGKGTIDVIDPNITNIAPADWTAEIMAYFSRVMQLNRFDNAALISGSNLYETIYIARAMAANAEGKGDFILWNDMPVWFDLFNIDSVNVNPDELFTYMVSRGSLAQVSKAFNPEYKAYMDMVKWTQPSQFLPGFTYDVYYENKCNNDSRFSDTHIHNFKVVLTADIFLNPYGCDSDGDGGGVNSGILRFRNQ